MHRRSAFRSRFVLRGFALGFLGVIAILPAVRGQAAIGHPLTVASKTASTLTEQVDFSLPEDPSGALEDSIEIFRVDVEHRNFGLDPVTAGPRTVPKSPGHTRAIISPPLLV